MCVFAHVSVKRRTHKAENIDPAYLHLSTTSPLSHPYTPKGQYKGQEGKISGRKWIPQLYMYGQWKYDSENTTNNCILFV